MKKLLFILVFVTFCINSNAYTNNIALGANVMTNGTFGGSSPNWGNGVLADKSTITDGKFLPVNQQWNVDTVFWYGSPTSDTDHEIVINLGRLFNVNKITLQADSNDAYHISYLDGSDQWHDLFDLAPPTSWGLDSISASFATIRAKSFKISASNGDGWYSISEFQAFNASTVPEPDLGFLFSLGGMLILLGHRRLDSFRC